MLTPEQIAALIIEDIEGRKGIGNEWEAIDPELQDEIRAEWSAIIRNGLGDNK